jgi:hypothetical protein
MLIRTIVAVEAKASRESSVLLDDPITQSPDSSLL